MLTYMASCGSTTCDKFDASGAQWFKVDQAGKKSDGSTWVQQDISEFFRYRPYLSRYSLSTISARPNLFDDAPGPHRPRRLSHQA